MIRSLQFVDRLLRGAAGSSGSAGAKSIGMWPGLAVVLASGMVYGAVMGGYGGFTGDRPLQILFSAIKVPMLILITTALAMPSFFVLNSLLGLRSDFPEVLRAVAVTQAAVAVVLAALAPYTALWYASSTNYHEATLWNALMFAAASCAAQWVLRRRYAILIERNRRHRTMLRAWLGVYAFVGIQMGWVLRPFIGQPGRPVTFLREDTWGNAYVIVFDLVWREIAR